VARSAAYSFVPEATLSGIDTQLVRARSRLRRLEPRQARERVRHGAILVDTRPEFQRRDDGEIPVAIVIERNHLEWRLDPTSGASIVEAVDAHVAWIILCDEGFSSSLAAAGLLGIGLSSVTDVIGGFRAWKSAGLAVIHPASPIQPRRPGGPFPSAVTPSALITASSVRWGETTDEHSRSVHRPDMR